MVRRYITVHYYELSLVCVNYGVRNFCQFVGYDELGKDVRARMTEQFRVWRMVHDPAADLSNLMVGASARGVRRAEPPKREKPKYEFKKDHDPNGIGKFYMGREIAQVMGYQRRRLAGTARAGEGRRTRQAHQGARRSKPGMTVADVGAGSGYHTFLMAPVVGEKGKVIASDIQQEMLDLITDEGEEAEGHEHRDREGQRRRTRSCRRASVDLILHGGRVPRVRVPVRDDGEDGRRRSSPAAGWCSSSSAWKTRRCRSSCVHKMSERQVLKEMGRVPGDGAHEDRRAPCRGSTSSSSRKKEAKK